MLHPVVSPLSLQERFRFSRKRGNALCFYAIPDGKPLHTFPGIADFGFTGEWGEDMAGARRDGDFLT
jgi:hypothetical protein